MIWLQVEGVTVNWIITQNQSGNGALLTARDQCTRPLQTEPCSHQIRLLIFKLTNATTGLVLFTEVLDNSGGSAAQV